MPRIARVILLAALGLDVAYAANPESLTKYILKVDSFGPVTVGMTPNEASIKLGIPLALAGPPDEDTSECHYVYPNGKFDEVGFMVEGGRITRIDIYSKAIATSGGIRIGNDEDQVKKFFTGKVKEEIHPYIGKDGKYLIVELKPPYAFVFETDRGRITAVRGGELASVKYIEGCL